LPFLLVGHDGRRTATRLQSPPDTRQSIAMAGPVPDPQLVAAIARKRLIGLSFKDKARVAEPHDYGIRDGRETLLAYQLSPETGWRWFEIERIADLEVLD